MYPFTFTSILQYQCTSVFIRINHKYTINRKHKSLKEVVFTEQSTYKKKRVVHHAMYKSCNMMMLRYYTARITNINKFLPNFLGLEESNNMEDEYIDDFILKYIPHECHKQVYIQGF